MAINATYTLQATPAQIEALSSLGLTLQDCRQMEGTHTLVAVKVESDRVREFWIPVHGGLEVYEMKGTFQNISERFMGGLS